MNRRLAWALPLASLLAAIIWLVGFRATMASETQQLKQQSQALEAQIRNLNATSDGTAPERTIAEWEAMLEDVRARYLRPSPANDLFDRLDRAANDAGLQVQRLDVRGGSRPPSGPNDAPMTQTASLTAEGSFNRLYTFLGDVTQGRPYLYVTLADLSVIDSNPADPILSLSATIVGRIAPAPADTNPTPDAGRSSP